MKSESRDLDSYQVKMNDDNFEQRLQRQPLRQIPGNWREDILSAANSARRPSPITSRPGFLSTFNSKLSALLWPHPRAWAGLAAVWLVIFAMNFSTHDDSTTVAKKVSPLTPEMRMVLEQQKMILAELIEPREIPLAEPRKLFPPKPRSELRNEFAMT